MATWRYEISLFNTRREILYLRVAMQYPLYRYMTIVPLTVSITSMKGWVAHEWWFSCDRLVINF